MICHKSPNKIKKLENGLFNFFKDFPHKLAIRFLQCYYKILAYNTTRKIKAKKPSLHSARPLPPQTTPAHNLDSQLTKRNLLS